MLRRTTRICLEACGVIVAGIVVLIGIAVWRLSTGPMSIDFLAPYLEEALTPTEGDALVVIGDVSVIWGGWSRALTIQADQVSVLRSDGTVVTTVPLMETKLSARALMRGKVAPTSLFLIAPALSLRRDAAGDISLGLAETGSEPADIADFDALLAGLIKAPNREHPSGYLTTIKIAGGDVTIVDEKSDLVWQIPESNILLERDDVGLRLDLDFELDLDGQVTRIHASGIFNREIGSIALGVDVGDLETFAVANRIDELSFLRDLHSVLNGQLTVALDTTGRIHEVGFVVEGGPGHLLLSDLYPDGLVFEGIALTGSIAPDRERLTIESLDVDLGGPLVSIEGSVEHMLSAPEAQVRVTMVEMPIDDFDYFWPPGIGGGARSWIVPNLSDGMIRGLEARGQFTVAGPEWREFNVADVTGTMAFDGVTVEYLPPMAPVRDVIGLASFDESRFDIDIQHGSAAGLGVAIGRIEITNIDSSDERISIDLDIAGATRRVLTLINSPPLGYADKLEVDPGNIFGHAEVDLALDFPLIAALTMDQIDAHAAARLTGLAWNQVALGLDASDGALALDVDNSRMVAEGALVIDNEEIAVVWEERFGSGGDTLSTVSVTGRVTQIMRQAAGMDFSPFLYGPGRVDLNYTVRRDGLSVLAGTADLSESALVLSALNRRKPVGVPATASFTVPFRDGRPIEVRPLIVESQPISARLYIVFDETGESVRSVQVAELISGRNQFSGALAFDEDGGQRIEIAGRQLDAAPFLAEFESDSSPGVEGSGEDGLPSPSRLKIDANLERVYYSTEHMKTLEGVSLSVQRDGEQISYAEFIGTLPGTEDAVNASIVPEGDERLMRIETDNAGALLSHLGLFDNMREGRMLVRGVYDDSVDPPPLRARIDIEDFRVVDAPVLAQILNVASFTGIGDALSGNGISFNRLRGVVRIEDGIYSISEARANGSALGVTLSGTFDDRRDELDMEGTIVPAYFVNSLLGNIPVLGELLVGEEGSGVFAASYKVNGSLDAPQITVNPLSALLPGVLRKIFDGAPADGEQAIYPYEDLNPTRTK